MDRAAGCTGALGTPCRSSSCGDRRGRQVAPEAARPGKGNWPRAGSRASDSVRHGWPGRDQRDGAGAGGGPCWGPRGAGNGPWLCHPQAVRAGAQFFSEGREGCTPLPHNRLPIPWGDPGRRTGVGRRGRAGASPMPGVQSWQKECNRGHGRLKEDPPGKMGSEEGWWGVNGPWKRLGEEAGNAGDPAVCTLLPALLSL